MIHVRISRILQSRPGVLDACFFEVWSDHLHRELHGFHQHASQLQ
jgi:hypothetical protein